MTASRNKRNGKSSGGPRKLGVDAPARHADEGASYDQDEGRRRLVMSCPNEVAAMTKNLDLGAASALGYKSPSDNAALLKQVKAGTERLALELEDYLTSKLSHLTQQRPRQTPPQSLDLSDDAVADLQLATARKLRELLPTNLDLLYKAQECNWVPLLLSWLNLHDRPAVQVEALLALTNIAELCAQQSYYQHSQAQASAITSAAQAAAAVVNGTTNGTSASQALWPNTANAGTSASPAPPTYPYPSLVSPAPGSVPFPPLSFSQTLSEEAVAAFDASLTSTIQNGGILDALAKNQNAFSLPPAPLFPSSANISAAQDNPALCPPTGGINFTSLAPPPGGAHNSVPSNSFLPPPTPVAGAPGSSLASFPQQLSASSQHLLLRHADAIPTLISLLSSPNREVYEQAMWILGSIAIGDSPGNNASNNSSGNSQLDREKSVSARDVILAAGVMNQLLRCLETNPTNLSLQRIGTWTLSNLVEGIFQQNNHGKSNSKSSDYSSSDEIDMAKLLPVLRRLLCMGDAEVLSYTCWTLSHLCDGPSSHIAAIVSSHDPRTPQMGLVPRLVELLLHPSWRVTKPALRTIGNIVCAECSHEDVSTYGCSADYTEAILECGAVPRLKELITHSNREIQKEACWTLSNIAAGTINQIQAVIDSGAIPPLVQLVQDKKTDQEVRSEACWVVLNATSCGSDAQIEVLVDQGCVMVLGVLLSEASLVLMALDGLERVLQIEECREMIRREKIENGIIRDTEQTRMPTLVSASMIETARDSHTSSAITKRAEKIWKKHFVSCALCKNSFSKHRTGDATFCDECKCYVCCNCNCQVYHLSYQEELWAESEEKTQQKKSSKKSKNKKKKEKQKQKKAKSVELSSQQQQQHQEEESKLPRSKKDSSEQNDGSLTENDMTQTKDDKIVKGKAGSVVAAADDKEPIVDETRGDTEGESQSDQAQQQPSIDFVLYLQQTGSIIALAKLMDALEYGDEHESLDDTELQLIKQQQQQQRMKEQAATSSR